MSDNPAEGERRRPLFAVVALVIPVAFFVLAEFVLRVAGQHREYPLFVPAPGQPAWMQAHPEAVKRFFADPDASPAVTIETAYFRALKPDDGLRLVVQGGSSAAGFPYGYGASVAGMLEQRLNRALPDRTVELISTAMSAVNSYTLLEFGDEILAQKPDAILIYAGHNEYLGIQGVGSALSSGLSPALTRLTQRLRRYAVYQFVERMLGSASGAAAAGAPAGGTLMARIAREKAIPFDSPLYRRGIEQFESNLDRLLSRYADAGVPVFIATLASNEKDLAPFVSATGAGTDADRWQALLAEGIVALESDRRADAERLLTQATELDQTAADGFYALGRLRHRQGRAGEARTLFLAAKDRDQLRFRAPEAFNVVVAELAERHGATRVDVQGALVGASPDRIIGNTLMLEHVHPNLDGYFLLADAFFDALVASGLTGPVAEAHDDAKARTMIPVSDVDRLFGEYKLQRVLGDWPFTKSRAEPAIPTPTNVVENLAFQMYHRHIGWLQAMDQLRQYYRQQGNDTEFTRVALILADAVPFAAAQQYTAGTALIKASRPAEALRYLERGSAAEPGNTNLLLALSHARILTGRHDAARAALERVLLIEPGNATARNALRQLQQPQ